MDTTKLPIELLPVKLISVMGTNRNDTSEAGLSDLKTSMKAHGLLQPIIVYRDSDKTLVCVAGARRLAAAKSLKWKEIPAKVIVAATGVTQELLREIRLVENLQRADLSPFEEAEQLAVLEAAYPTPPRLEDLAAKLGKSTRWLAERRAINKLSPALKAYVQRCNWPCHLIIMLAREPASMHDAITKRLNDLLYSYQDEDSDLPYIPDAKHLKDILEWHHRNLSTAPWILDDEKLLPSAGACTTCTKRSQANALLFPDAVNDIDQCLDQQCWDSKGATLMKLHLSKLQKKKLKPVVISDTPFETLHDIDVCTWKKLEPCQPNDPGAFPAVSANYSDFGKVHWVKPWKPEKNTKPVDQDTGKASKPRTIPAEELTQEEQISQVVQKRMLATINYWKDDTLPNIEPGLGLVMALVASFGTEPFPVGPENWEAFEAISDKLPATLAKDVYEEVYPVLQKRLEDEVGDDQTVRHRWRELHQQAKAFNDHEALEYCWKQALTDHKWPKYLADVADPNKVGEVPGEEIFR